MISLINLQGVRKVAVHLGCSVSWSPTHT